MEEVIYIENINEIALVTGWDFIKGITLEVVGGSTLTHEKAEGADMTTLVWLGGLQ